MEYNDIFRKILLKYLSLLQKKLQCVWSMNWPGLIRCSISTGWPMKLVSSIYVIHHFCSYYIYHFIIMSWIWQYMIILFVLITRGWDCTNIGVHGSGMLDNNSESDPFHPGHYVIIRWNDQLSVTLYVALFFSLTVT